MAINAGPNPETDITELDDVQLKVKLLSQVLHEHFIIRRCLLTDLVVSRMEALVPILN